MVRILLVEDNPINADMLRRRLTRSGFEVAIAVDGLEAVARATSDRPTIVLMDMSLPEIDGWEATRRICANASTAAIPIIALTAHAMTSDRAKCFEAGCQDFDTKPIDYPRLLEKIRALVPKEVSA
jgi:two-component system, cell cycle response regulator DivK